MNTTIEKGCFTHHNYSNVGNVTLLNPRERQREIHFLMKSKNMYILTIKVQLQNISWGARSQTNNSNSKYFPFSVILGQFDISFLIFFTGEAHIVFTSFIVKLNCQNCLQFTFCFCVPNRGKFPFPHFILRAFKMSGPCQSCPHKSLHHFSSSSCGWQISIVNFLFQCWVNSHRGLWYQSLL